MSEEASEMVRHVAKALYEAEHWMPGSFETEESAPMKEYWYASARDAIKAMGSPNDRGVSPFTPEMHAAFWAAFDGANEKHGIRESTMAAWSAAIDASLGKI